MTGERRRHPRRKPSPGEPLANLRMRTGAEMVAVDIGNGGARTHTTTWQRPGARVEVHLLTRSGRVLQRARVMRVAVVAVRPTVVTYDVALAFDSVMDTTPRVSPTREDTSATLHAPELPLHTRTTAVDDEPNSGRLQAAMAPSLEGADEANAHERACRLTALSR